MAGKKKAEKKEAVKVEKKEKVEVKKVEKKSEPVIVQPKYIEGSKIVTESYDGKYHDIFAENGCTYKISDEDYDKL